MEYIAIIYSDVVEFYDFDSYESFTVSDFSSDGLAMDFRRLGVVVAVLATVRNVDRRILDALNAERVYILNRIENPSDIHYYHKYVRSL